MSDADLKKLGVDPIGLVAIQRLFSGLPTRMEDRHFALMLLRRFFQDEVAIAARPILDEYAERLTDADLAERRSLLLDLHQDLAVIGLVQSCPKSGLPGLLQVDPPETESDPPAGRFVFRTVDEFDQLTTSFVSDELPTLRAMPERMPRLKSTGRSFETPREPKRGR